MSPLDPDGLSSRWKWLISWWVNAFRTLTANIRSRRGSKVAINVPIYKDVNTPSPFVDPTIPHNRKLWPEDDGEKSLTIS